MWGIGKYPQRNVLCSEYLTIIHCTLGIFINLMGNSIHQAHIRPPHRHQAEIQLNCAPRSYEEWRLKALFEERGYTARELEVEHERRRRAREDVREVKLRVQFKEIRIQDDCVICQCSMKDGKICAVDCTHTFHIECIQKWKDSGKRTCPTCRENCL